ncbi:MAG: hypothetical protein H5T86_12675, partial [Armatimonadetes bacterium]|nr:hypothetical protein [Armatimonadota bacterium]
RNIWLNVHTRHYGERDGQYTERLLECIAQSGRADQIVLACFADQAERAKARLPQISICNMTAQGHAGTDYPEKTIELGADFLQLFGWHERTGEAVALLHQHGIKVNYFKADDPEEIARLLDLGVDFVLTDRLDEALAAWRRWSGEQ